MAKYKIAIIGLLLANNTVAGHGTVVTEDQLIGDPKKLLAENFITEVDEDDESEPISLEDGVTAQFKAANPAEPIKTEEPAKVIEVPAADVISPEPAVVKEPSAPAPEPVVEPVAAAPVVEPTPAPIVADPASETTAETPAAGPDPAAILNTGKKATK